MTDTIDLPGNGPVPALAENLHPVAVAAVDLPSGTYGVVAWNGQRPALLNSPAGLSTCAARNMAVAFRDLHGIPVWIVRRTVYAVTVFRPELGEPGYLLGSVLAPRPASLRPADPSAQYWESMTNYVAHDAAAQHDHDANVVEAMRRAHRLGERVTSARVYTTALLNPLPAEMYIRAYVRVVEEGTRRDSHLYATHRS